MIALQTLLSGCANSLGSCHHGLGTGNVSWGACDSQF